MAFGRVCIRTRKQGYSPEQVNGTITVGELIKVLQDYDEDMLVYTDFDRGYTFGGINSGSFYVDYDYTDES